MLLELDVFVVKIGGGMSLMLVRALIRSDCLGCEKYRNNLSTLPQALRGDDVSALMGDICHHWY